MGRFHRGRSKWQERNVVPDRRHRWPVSNNGVVVGAIEMQRLAFIAYTIKGERVGKFNSQSDARQALVMQRR